MNETDALHWHLHKYGAILSRQIDRLYNALEELQRTTLLLLETNRDASDRMIDAWLSNEDFQVDEDGFFQSNSELQAYREGAAPETAISFSWGAHLRDDPIARRHLYSHRNIGPHLRDIHSRIGNIGWIYYQDASNTSLQFPFIDQETAITPDFDWTSYHTFVSVSPENNPERKICWTPPSIDYAGEGLILSVSIPVWMQNQFAGLWSIDLPIRFLYQDFASAKPFADLDQWITDGNGLLLLHDKLSAELDPRHGQLFLHPLKDLGGSWSEFDISTIQGKQSGLFKMNDARAVPWVIAYLNVAEINWTLFCGVPEASIEEVAAGRLQAAFKQLAGGHFGSMIEASSSNVLVASLVEEFNNMSSQLEKLENDRLQMEEQLRQAQKMEAIGRLAGGVAHDYNNMINVIMGYAELALKRLEPGDPLYHNFSEILAAAKRSMEITHQLLAFARRQTITPQVLDLNSEVGGLIKMIKQLLGEEIELCWQPGEDLWTIYLDLTQISQILINLCVNSRDAIEGTGTITIETSNIVRDISSNNDHLEFNPGPYVQMTISDDGVGMDAKTLENIFEPFFSTKACGKGTGLGLATVYGIMKQNNGFINVYSEPGRGTTFRLYFPRFEGTVRPASTRVVADLEARGETILIVEDEESILALSRNILANHGYNVLTASTPATAIELASNYNGGIDLLITDVVMPDLNGRELADRLKVLFPKMKILFMSGYPADIIAQRGILESDFILLQKPFSTSGLALKVATALRTEC